LKKCHSQPAFFLACLFLLMASSALRCAFLALATMHVGGAMELPAEMLWEGDAAEITGTGGNVTAFPEAMFGVWMPKKGVPMKTILGPFLGVYHVSLGCILGLEGQTD